MDARQAGQLLLSASRARSNTKTATMPSVWLMPISYWLQQPGGALMRDSRELDVGQRTIGHVELGNEGPRQVGQALLRLASYRTIDI